MPCEGRNPRQSQIILPQLIQGKRSHGYDIVLTYVVTTCYQGSNSTSFP